MIIIQILNRFTKKRLITDQVKSAISKFPVVVITGARQVGKTTFLQNEFKDFKYVSLDDFSALQQAKEDTLSFIDPIPLMLKGFMPPLMFLKERQDILLWWEGYVRAYLETEQKG